MSLNLKDKILKFLFDSSCSICKKEVEDSRIYVCRECEEGLKRKKYLHKRKNIYYLFYYEDEIKMLILDYKFNERKELSKFFADLIKKELLEVIKENDIEVVIPVPASKKKLKNRGFNQVELILDEIGINYEKMGRVKDTLPMYKIDDKNFRKLNVKSAFSCDFYFENKNILIVDDIITTGSTMREMVKKLQNSGNPKGIFLFSISISKKFRVLEF